MRVTEAVQQRDRSVVAGDGDALIGFGAEHLDVGEHSAQVRCRDPAQLAGVAVPPAPMGRSPEAGVCDTDLGPARMTGRCGGLGGVVVDEAVERLDV